MRKTFNYLVIAISAIIIIPLAIVFMLCVPKDLFAIELHTSFKEKP